MMAEGREDVVDDFPYGSISVETQTTTLYQADCERCGWHTRQADSETWVKRMGRIHFRICPNPYYRNGAVMDCGCWYYASPGDSASTINRGPTKATCPLHGETFMVKANVDEPIAYGKGRWTPALASSATNEQTDAPASDPYLPKGPAT